MAEIPFTGPGTITLLNNTSSFKIVEKQSGNDVPFGSLVGNVGDSIDIPAGDFCAVYSDAWGADQCNCPPIPELTFGSAGGATGASGAPLGSDCGSPMLIEGCPGGTPIPVELATLNTSELLTFCDPADPNNQVILFIVKTDGIPTGGYVDENGAAATPPAGWTLCGGEIAEEVPCGNVCWDDGTDSGTACHVMTRGTDGLFTGAQRYLDTITGTEIDPAFIGDCPELNTITNEYCVS